MEVASTHRLREGKQSDKRRGGSVLQRGDGTLQDVGWVLRLLTACEKASKEAPAKEGKGKKGPSFSFFPQVVTSLPLLPRGGPVTVVLLRSQAWDEVSEVGASDWRGERTDHGSTCCPVWSRLVSSPRGIFLLFVLDGTSTSRLQSFMVS